MLLYYIKNYDVIKNYGVCIWLDIFYLKNTENRNNGFQKGQSDFSPWPFNPTQPMPETEQKWSGNENDQLTAAINLTCETVTCRQDH